MGKKYNLDTAMKNIWQCLLRDANSAVDVTISHNFANHIAEGDIVAFRTRKWPNWFANRTPYQTKWAIQLETFFKRYKFEHDVFTEEELQADASRKFIADQVRISGPLDLRQCDLLVLRRARCIIQKILGEYSEEEHSSLCKFSRRANNGIPYRDSYLDIKMGCLTGTTDQIAWFKRNLACDPLLEHVIKRQAHRGASSYSQSSALNLAKVPKSWKALRTMLPNTVIGSFYSDGLGTVIRNRLKDAGANITSLQFRHRVLAKRYSRTRSHVTADLSAASDSFNRELLRRLLPARWYRAVVMGLPRFSTIDGDLYNTQSTMTMGMGHTFPLQTLLFKALLTAVQELTDVKGIISVYGDDLIYPTGMHSVVENIFPRLNLRLNTDKTFVTSYFRESCGGDYCHGIDVRPFCPEGEYQLASSRRYEAFLYKLYNGLLLRWSEFEVPQTIHWLQKELANVCTRILQVPPSFPATAGVVVTTPQKPGLIPWSPVLWEFNVGYAFRYLTEVPEKRYILHQAPYYWDTLRQASAVDVQDVYTDGSTRVQWANGPKYVKVASVRRRTRELLAFEAKKSSSKLLSQTARQSYWPQTG